MKVIYMAARYDRREEIVGYANELRNNGYTGDTGEFHG